jgi:ferric-dicitrate binding protein FerR (iron transport regulator)
MAKKQKTQWEIMRENRLETWKKLSPKQRGALKEVQNAWHELQGSYRELCHPTFDDIVKMDEAYHRLAQFMIEE